MSFNIATEDGTKKIAADVVGTATVPATDDQVQWVGICTGTTGSPTPVSEANSLPVVLPSDVVSVTPTIDTNVFASGDAVGGKQTITGACRVSGGVATLDTLTVIDKGNQKANLTVLLFDSDPSAATITNNAAFAFSTDIAKVVGKVNVATADYETVDSKAIACLKNLGLTMKASGSAVLYAAVVTTSTPTYLSTGDLTFRYGFKQD